MREPESQRTLGRWLLVIAADEAEIAQLSNSEVVVWSGRLGPEHLHLSVGHWRRAILLLERNSI